MRMLSGPIISKVGKLLVSAGNTFKTTFKLVSIKVIAPAVAKKLESLALNDDKILSRLS